MIINFLLEDDEQSIWQAFYMEQIGRVMEDASNMVADQYGLNIRFDLHNTEAMELLERQGQKFAKQINETTWKQLKQSLIEGFLAGEGEKKLSDRVEHIMTLSKRQRAATIARTEVFRAVNESHYITFRDNGIQYKEWLTARDERVREAHAIADGQKVAMNEPFIVGGEKLMYPGDPSGSAGNVVNCRCVVLPVI